MDMFVTHLECMYFGVALLFVILLIVISET